MPPKIGNSYLSGTGEMSLQMMANASPQVRQLQSVQRMADVATKRPLQPVYRSVAPLQKYSPQHAAQTVQLKSAGIIQLKLSAGVKTGATVIFIDDAMGDSYQAIPKDTVGLVKSVTHTKKNVRIEILSEGKLKGNTYMVVSDSVEEIGQNKAGKEQRAERKVFSGEGFDEEKQRQVIAKTARSDKNKSTERKASFRIGKKIENLEGTLSEVENALSDSTLSVEERKDLSQHYDFLKYRKARLSANKNNDAIKLDEELKGVSDPLQQFFTINAIPSQQLSLWAMLAKKGKGAQAKTRVEQLNKAYGISTSSPQEIIRAQAETQNWLKAELDMGEVMDVQRTIGFEFEFANYVVTKYDEKYKMMLEDTDHADLPSHEELGASAPMSSMFNLPFVLETDSGKELEIGMPPMLIGLQGKGPDKSIISRLWNILRQHMGMIRDANDYKMLDTVSMGAYGLGDSWSMKGSYKNLRVSKDRPKKAAGALDQVYSQLNISLTPKEMADFIEKKGKKDWNSYSTEHFAEAYAAVKTELDPQVETSSGETAVVHIAKGLSNLMAIPSLQLFTDRPGIGQENGVESTVKETFGIWIKDSIPNLVDSSLPDEASRTEVIAALKTSKASLKERFQVIIDKALIHVKDDLSLIEEKGVSLERLSNYKVRFNAELDLTLDGLIRRLAAKKPKVEKNKSGLKYGKESFPGTGKGVRKETFINAPTGENTPLHIAEIRNQLNMDKFLGD